jgi:hypothetical protein
MIGDSWFAAGQGSFNLFSGYFTAAGDVGLQLRVRGYDGATLKYDNTYTLETTGPRLLNLGYVEITQVVFSYAGGVPGFPEWALNFVMDDLAYSLTTAEPLVIVTQPVGQRVMVGGQATFQVVATPAALLTYEWRHDGIPIGGAIGSNLVINPVVAADAGTYSVRVSNGGASVISSNATLVVASGVFASVEATPLGIELQVNGEAGMGYTLEISSDLKGWDPLVVRPNNPASWTYVDTTAPVDRPRFYRLKRDP